MGDSNIKPIFRIISLILITTFIALDISWAYPPDPSVRNSTLAAPSLLQQEPINDLAARRQQSTISDGTILGAVCSIAKFLLEEKIKLKHLDQVLTRELGSAVQGMDLSRVMVQENGVVLIPCKIEGKERIIQVALKDNAAVKDLKGREWPVLDKYVVKELPEDHKDPEKIVKEERLSFVMIKPDGIAEKDLIIEKLEKRLKTDGGRIVKIFDPVRLDEAKAREFYREHMELPFFRGLVTYIQSGMVIPILVQSGKIDAIKNVRDDVVGPTMGIIKTTGAVAVGTIRGDLMADADRRAQPIPNRIHASDSVANVVREANLVIGKDTFTEALRDLVQEPIIREGLDVQKKSGSLYEDIIASIKQDLDRRGEVSFEELFDLVQSLVPSSMENLHKALVKLKPLSERKDGVEDTEILTAIARAKKDYGLSDRETEILRLAFLGTGQGMSPRFEELEPRVLLSGGTNTAVEDNPVYNTMTTAIVANNFDYSSNDTVRASNETLSVNLVSKTAVVTRSDGGTATFTKIALVNTAVSPVPKKLLRAGDYTDSLGRAWSVYGRLSELKGFKDAAGTPIDMTTKKIVVFTYADSVQKLFSKASVYDRSGVLSLPRQSALTSINIGGRDLNIYGTFSAFKNAKYTVTRKNLKITIVNRSNSRDKKTFSVGPKRSILSEMNLTADYLYYTVRTNGVSKLKSFDLHTGAPLATISPVDVNTHPAVPAQPSLVSVQSGDRRLFVRDRLPDGTLGQQYALISKGVNWSPASIGMDPAAITQEFVKWYQADIPLMAQMGINVVRVYHDFGTGQDAMNILDMFYNYGIKVIMTVDSPQHGVIADMNNISTVVDAYKNHPAILMWAIGNEWDINNYYGTFTSLEQSAQFTEQAAQLIKSLDSNHPVTSVIGDIDRSGASPLSTANNIVNNLVPDIDVWGINVYRGLSLGVVFQQWRTISQKPMLIAEFGADSYDHRINGQNQAMQASMDTGIWDEVFFDLSAERTDGATVGVLAFEWNDEWWKDGSNAIHNVASGTNYSQPDGYADEEWFGVVGIDRAPKTLYSQLQTRYLNGQSAVVLNSNPTITVTSQGNQSGASSFSVNGKSAFYRAGGAGGGRGINVAILDSHTGIRMDDARTFDTWTGQGGFGGLHTNFQQLIDYLNSLPDGTVISLSICDEGGFTMVDGTPWPNDPYVTAAYQTLESLGSTKIRNVGYWGGWAMVTVKGQGVVAEAYSSPNAPVMIQAQVSLMLDPNYGKRSAPRAQNMESTAIIAAVNKELDQKKEWMFPELFSIVQSKVPVSMAGLTSALTDLQPLSLHSDLNADIIVDAVKQAGEKYGLSEGETEILRLALLGPGQGAGEIAPEAKDPDADAARLADIVKSSLNDERAKFIAVGKKVAGHLDKNMTTTEITERVNRAISAIEALDKESVSPEMLASTQFLKKNLNQFEADGGVGSLIILARRAKREGQKLIIGLETDWIPGGNTEHSLQEKAIFALMNEIGDIGEALKSMGLDNVEIVRGSADSLADSLKMAAAKTDRFNNTGMHNIVVMASKDTIASESFREFRNAGEKDKPFLTGIDPTELIKLYEKYGESISNQLHIKLAAWLYLTLEVAAGKEPPNLSWIKYDSTARILLLMPGAEIIDYELLKNTYAAEKAALAAA